MGIDTHYYVVYGVELEYNEDFNEDFDEVFDDLEANVIVDGMSGKYIVIGEILFNSGNLRWGELEDTREVIDINKLPEYEFHVKETFKKYFPKWYHLVNQPFKLIAFVHYS